MISYRVKWNVYFQAGNKISVEKLKTTKGNKCITYTNNSIICEKMGKEIELEKEGV